MTRKRLRRTQPPTVLVVEDEPTVRTLAESILEDFGYAILSAANAREADILLRAGRPVDLLFTDINMPDGPNGLDGLELARTAIELRPGLRVLYTTGGAITEGMTARFVDGGRFLQKPYTRERLIKALGALLPPDQSSH